MIPSVSSTDTFTGDGSTTAFTLSGTLTSSAYYASEKEWCATRAV